MRLISTNPSEPGVFAFGQVAVGVFAFGQAALGVVAIGQLARGVFCLGQGAIGVVAVGQGAIGLFYATAMVGIAGTHGRGFVVHTLPLLVEEPRPELEPAVRVDDLRARRIEAGWLSCLLRDGALVPEDSPDAQLDAGAVGLILEDARERGCDRVHVHVRAETVFDEVGYRAGGARVLLVGDSAVPYHSRPRRFLAFAGAKSAADISSIAPRALLWIVAAAIVVAVSLLPLVEALFG
jgi:hypothetical protein